MLDEPDDEEIEDFEEDLLDQEEELPSDSSREQLDFINGDKDEEEESDIFNGKFDDWN